MEKKKHFNFWIKFASVSLDIVSLIRVAFL